MKKNIISCILIASACIVANPVNAKDQGHGKHGRGHAYGHHNQHHQIVPQHRYSHEHHYKSFHSNRSYSHRRTQPHHYSNHRYYGHSERGYYNDHYVGDYFKIIGGTILINEMLYHGHRRR